MWATFAHWLAAPFTAIPFCNNCRPSYHESVIANAQRSLDERLAAKALDIKAADKLIFRYKADLQSPIVNPQDKLGIRGKLMQMLRLRKRAHVELQKLNAQSMTLMDAKDTADGAKDNVVMMRALHSTARLTKGHLRSIGTTTDVQEMMDETAETFDLAREMGEIVAQDMNPADAVDDDEFMEEMGNFELLQEAERLPAPLHEVHAYYVDPLTAAAAAAAGRSRSPIPQRQMSAVGSSSRSHAALPTATGYPH